MFLTPQLPSRDQDLEQVSQGFTDWLLLHVKVLFVECCGFQSLKDSRGHGWLVTGFICILSVSTRR